MENKLSEPTVKLAQLEDVLEYENEEVIYKFLEYWNLSLEEGQDLFIEMKKWLWLNAFSYAERRKGAESPHFSITFPLFLMDEMWHTFVLFTLDYRRFCMRFFGYYLNHAPATRAEKEKVKAEIQADPDAYWAKQEALNEARFSYIYDHLGEETLVKWFSEWTDRNTSEYLASIRKNHWE